MDVDIFVWPFQNYLSALPWDRQSAARRGGQEWPQATRQRRGSRVLDGPEQGVKLV